MQSLGSGQKRVCVVLKTSILTTNLHLLCNCIFFSIYRLGILWGSYYIIMKLFQNNMPFMMLCSQFVSLFPLATSSLHIKEDWAQEIRALQMTCGPQHWSKLKHALLMLDSSSSSLKFHLWHTADSWPPLGNIGMLKSETISPLHSAASTNVWFGYC